MAARGLRPHSFLRAQMRLLRFRVAGRRRPSGRPIPGGPRARDRNLRSPSRRRSTRSSWAAARPRGSTPRSSETLCRIIKQWFILSPGGEWTVEANPGTIDAEKADVLAQAGVNRISLGAQSFQPRLLAVLEREHGRAEVETALEVVRPRFRPLVARPDLRRAGLNDTSSGATTSRRRSRSGHRIFRATGWSSRRGRPLEPASRAAWCSPSTRRSSA